VLEWENGDKGKGIELFKEAVAAKPSMCAFQWSLGLALDGLDAIKHLQEASKLLPTSIEILTQLAKRQKKEKMMDEAEQSYRRLLELEPAKAHTYYKLGHIVLRKRTEEGYKEAASLFDKAVELDPEHDSAKYWSSVAAGQAAGDAAPPATAPPSYVQKLFDGYAEKFDEHLVGKLQYQTPDLLQKLVADTLASTDEKGDSKFRRCADLGCGTGLAGVAFRDLIAEGGHLGGVDLSAKMVDKARERDGLYQELVVGDLVPFLAQNSASTDDDEKYDLVVAADTLPYIGGLEPLMQALQASCATGAYFAYSVELEANKQEQSQSESSSAKQAYADAAATTQEGAQPPSPPSSTGYRLQVTGRYCHTCAYVKSSAEAHGFAVVAKSEATIRYNAGSPIHGLLVLLRYNGA
jgi:predicted TPR repeat methyltransferase